MPATSTTYTIDSLAGVLQVPAERLRAWVRAGLVRPVAARDGVAEFDFRQVSAAKTLCDLLASGVTLGKVRKSLDHLRHWRSEAEYPLEQLAILQRSGTLLVRLEEGDLAETNGQYHFDFDRSENEPPSPMRITGGPRNEADWLAQAHQQEEQGLLAEAAGSYRRALLMGGPNVSACFGLANVLREMGQRQQAIERYLQVVELQSNHSDGWNNLGLCLSELGSQQEAVGAFKRALEVDPDNWRAHYNLADVLEDVGEQEEASVHWREYLRHDRDSEQAKYARSRIRA